MHLYVTDTINPEKNCHEFGRGRMTPCPTLDPSLID